jgi:hypothetical protein
MLSLYKMLVKIKKNLDSIRCQFLWQGTSTKNRFALIKWTKVCMPRHFGGLGILNLHLYEHLITVKVMVEIERSSVPLHLEINCFAQIP